MEQLHRIYKLCGSPSEEYWRKIKLPSTRKHAQHRPLPQYKRRIREVYKDFSPEAVSLMDTLLALDPAERTSATSALMSDVSIYELTLSRKIGMAKLTNGLGLPVKFLWLAGVG